MASTASRRSPRISGTEPSLSVARPPRPVRYGLLSELGVRGAAASAAAKVPKDNGYGNLSVALLRFPHSVDFLLHSWHRLPHRTETGTTE